MLFGRDVELAEVESRVRASRLVSVIGPGGVGKTTVARAAAARVAADSALGVFEVDLTMASDERAVTGLLAAQLGFDSFDALLAVPADRPALVLLDSCEHLLDAAAATVVQLLGACRQPTVLATSRSPLDVPGESVVALAPLPPPVAGADPAASAAVQLFVHRARDAGVALEAEDLELVAELCRRLDGLPLALEIAAARARTMSLSEMADRLTDAIDVLDRPRFRGEPRHRSIAEAIRWSYDLLPERQALELERLSVFGGPFTGASAQAVSGASAADLDELVDASLVTVDDRTGTTTRYRLLDTVRHFAADRLDARGTRDEVDDRFVDHVVATVQEIVRGSGSTWRPDLVRDLVASYDDIATALAHAVDRDASPARAYRLCGVLWSIVHQAHADDIVELCRRTIQRWPPDGSPAGAAVAAAFATAEYVTGNPEEGLGVAERALRSLGTPSPATVTLHRAIGQSRRALGDLAGAEDAFRAGARIGHEHGWTAMALELDTAAATVSADRGEVARAMAEVEAVLERSRSIGSAITTCWARTTLGWIALRADVGHAQATIDAALDEARRIDYPITVAVGLRSRVYGHLLAGQPASAVEAARELLDDLLGRGALSNARILLDAVAVVASRSGHPAWEPLAATARALPVTTLTAAGDGPIPLPPTAARPAPRREAVALAREVLDELAAASATPEVAVGGTDVPAGDEPPPSIRRVGDVYELTFAGRTVAVRRTKGVTDIVRLIEARGAEVHALDLAGAAVSQPSTGEVIDAAARRDYEERIRTRQEELDEAEANGDYERAYRAQVELDALVEHLTAALGRSGRARRGSDTAERARSAVTHRVRSAIRQIGALHPRLGEHLTYAVTTGTYLSYRPERPVVWLVDAGNGA